MKKIFLFCLFALSAHAVDSVQTVLVRDGKSNNQKLIRATLTDFKTDKAFDGKYFKVVVGKSNEPVRFDHKDSKILLKAATTYYHATIARKFFIEKLKSDYVKNLGQITIRLEITNKFHIRAHFASDNIEEEYNNALSVRPGETPSYVQVQDKWGHEIWFRPKKVVSTRDLENDLGENPFAQNMRLANDVAQDFVNNSLQFDSLNFIFHPEYQDGPFWHTLVRHAGTLIVVRGIYELSKKTDNWFLKDTYYMDTALIPEVIYHEYAHIALSDHIEPHHSTPMVEGMADFFATAINPMEHMMAPIDDVSNNAGKHLHNDKGYQPWFEDLSKSQSDYVLSVLWKTHKTIDGGALDLIYEARKSMSTETTSVHDGLPRALLSTCRLRAGKTSLCRRQLLESIRLKGF